jgi:EmrB/QacA subfamily drug resistance transporter
MESTGSLEAAVERQHYNVTLAALTIAGIAYALLQTMVVPALPALQRDLHTSTAWVTWLLTSFLLVSAIATPVIGKLGDQYGKGRLLRISLLALLVGCVASVFAWDIWSLIAGRAIQGLGGAVFPLSFGIIKDEFPPEKVGAAVGTVSAVFAVGGGLGLVFSGLILDNLSWRWVFVIAAVAVGGAVAMVWRFVPESPIRTESRVDVPGALLLSLALGSLLLGITEGSAWGWGSGRLLALFAVAAAALGAWAFVELRVAEPMLDMRMLAYRPVLLTNLTGLIGGFAMFGSYVLLPNFAETPRGLSHAVAGLVHYGFGASSTTVGLYLLPGTLIGVLSGPLVGTMGGRWGPKWPLAVGVGLAAAGSSVLAVWHDHPWQVVVGMFLLGAGFPFMFGAMAKIIVDSVRPQETGVAGGINTVMRTVGGVLGAQFVAAILAGNRIPGTTVPTENAFVLGFWIAAGAALVAVVIAVFVTPLWPRRPEKAARPSIEGFS